MAALPEMPELEGLQEDAFYVFLSLVIVAGAAAAHNMATPDNPDKISPVEISSNCYGVNAAGMCIGIQRLDHETFNYENYTEAEPGTANFYKRVESELLLQSYEICQSSEDTWKTEAEYRNKTAQTWEENEEVDLWSCKKTFHRNMTEQ